MTKLKLLLKKEQRLLFLYETVTRRSSNSFACLWYVHVHVHVIILRFRLLQVQPSYFVNISHDLGSLFLIFLQDAFNLLHDLALVGLFRIMCRD